MLARVSTTYNILCAQCKKLLVFLCLIAPGFYTIILNKFSLQIFGMNKDFNNLEIALLHLQVGTLLFFGETRW